MNAKIDTPSGHVITDDAHPDGLVQGRVVETTGATNWVHVTEEAPINFETFGRQGGEWVPVAGGVTVTEIVPAVANVGTATDLPVKLYGSGLSAASVVNWNGVAIAPAATFNATDKTMNFSVTVAAMAVVGVHTVTVTGATGAAGFHVLDVAKTLAVTEIVPTMSDVNIAADLSARVYGAGFTATTVAQWTNAAAVTTPMATTFVDANTLNVTITSAMTAVPGIYTVTALDGALIGKGGAGFHILPIPAGLQITSLIPSEVIVPSTTPLLVSAYGAMFTPTCVCVVSYQGAAGVDQVTNFVSVSELTFTVDPTPFPTDDFVTVTVRDTATGEVGAGAEQFSFVTVKNSLYRGRWDPQNNVPDIGGLAGKELEWMWTVDLADPLVPIAAPPNATGIAGTLCNEGDHAVWTGAAFVLVTKAAGGLYQGRFQPALNLPDIGALTPKQDKWMWVVDTALRNTPEQAPANMGNIAGLPLIEGDHVIYDVATTGWLLISQPTTIDGIIHAGIGLEKVADPTGAIINLQPPLVPAGDATKIGGIRVPPRTLTQGLQIEGDGLTQAPLATDLLAGSIVEPKPDGLEYHRTRDTAGVSTWTLADKRTLHLELLVPNHATIGGAQQVVEAHGHKFTAASVVMWDGVAVPTTFVSESELLFFVNPAAETVRTAVVTVNDSGSVGTGDAPFYFFASDKLYQGTWEPVTNTPDILTPPKGDKWMWLVDTVDPRKEELVPTTIPGIAGMVTREGDQVVWDATAATFRLVGTRALMVTEIVPNQAAIGSPEIDVQVYGAGFTATTVVLWEGLPITTQFLDSNKLRIKVNPSAVPLPTRGFAVVGVRDTVGPVDGNGSVGFLFGDQMYDFGLGLSVSPGAPGVPPAPDDPPIVNLQPAGLAPRFLGGVWVPPRGELNGLEINISSQPGMLVAPPATDKLAGVIVEPPVGPAQLWARTTSTPGTGKWEPVFNIGTLTYKGAWKPATNDPNIHAVANKQNGDFWICDCVDPLVDETPPLGSTPGLDNVMLSEGDFVIWNEAAQLWNHIERETALSFERGLTETGGKVDLDFAGFTPDRLGGVWVRPASGIGLTPDGGVNLAPTTPDQIGGIVDAPYGTGVPADPMYARQNATWVQIKGAEIAGNVPANVGVVYVPARNKTSQGLDLNADGGLYAPPATHEHLGTIVEPLNDGKQYVRKTEGGNSSWVETTAKPVDIAGNVPAKVGVVYVPARNKTSQGLDLNADGGLYSPPATNEHLGSILDPLPDGKQYVRTRSTTGVSSWVPSLGGVIISDTPPPNPLHGQLWWESDSGDLFIYYDDGSSAQWVEAVAGAEPGVTMHVSDAPPDPMIAKAKDLWFDSDSGALAINYQDVDTLQWVQICDGAGAAAGGVQEAPIDGTPYSRQDATWVPSTTRAAIADTAPASPMAGAMWFRSTDASLHVSYQDANSQQWIAVNSGSPIALTAATDRIAILEARIAALEARVR